MIQVCADPLGFVNKEFLLKATLPALLAALTWTLPLCAIASPASLTTIAGVSNTSTVCKNIPTLNLGREDGFSDFIYDDSTQPTSFWDTVSNKPICYAGSSTFLARLSTLTLLGSKGSMQPLNPCPLPGNCSYSIDFAEFIPGGNYSYYSLSRVAEDKDERPIWWNDASDSDLGCFRSEPEL
jgi:hypothetical protein